MYIKEEDFKNLIIASFKDIMSILFKDKQAAASIKLLPPAHSLKKWEIVIVIQFFNGVDAKILLACTRDCAMELTKRIGSLKQDVIKDDEIQKQAIKDCLGEMMNILAGRVVNHLEKKSIKAKLTTPAIIIGKNMFVTLYEENAIKAHIGSNFGVFDIVFSFI